MSNVDLRAFHLALGATLAPDGVPLHYQNLSQAYQSIYTDCVIMERPHEGRLLLKGRSAKSLLHRLSTQDIEGLPLGVGCGAVFLNANGRILERVESYVVEEDHVLLLTSPGRGEAVKGLLERNIFYNDEVVIEDLTSQTTQLVIHGATAEASVRLHLLQETDGISPMGYSKIEFEGQAIELLRRKTYHGSHWSIIVHDLPTATRIWNLFTHANGVIPAGALTFNMLRIAAGIPAIPSELTSDYIPLEVGLWDEISFTKGCYIGQEIIARMESRQQLAKVLVKVRADTPILPQTPLHYGQTNVGVITSATQLPTEEYVGLATIKPAYRESAVTCNGVAIQLEGLAGSPPPKTMLKELVG